jgi:hypothetical protein
MENISPSPASRISPLSPDDRKGSEDLRPPKHGKVQPAARKSPSPAPPEVAEREDKHELDERA